MPQEARVSVGGVGEGRSSRNLGSDPRHAKSEGNISEEIYMANASERLKLAVYLTSGSVARADICSAYCRSAVALAASSSIRLASAKFARAAEGGGGG